MLAFGQRVGPGVELPARLVAPLPGLGQANIGIATKGQPLLLAHIAVFVAPQFRAVRMDLQIEAALIGMLGHSVGRTNFPDLQLGQRHGRISSTGPGEDLRRHFGVMGPSNFRVGPYRPFRGTSWPRIA